MTMLPLIPKEIREVFRAAAFDLADSRQMCCRADLELIDQSLNMMHGLTEHGFMKVVQLGAGSGTMSLIIMSNINTELLMTVDHSLENLSWESTVLENCGWTSALNKLRTPPMHIPQHSKSDADVLGNPQLFKPDLIIFDADHSYEAVKADLKRWQPLAAPKATFFIHDYDGAKAPEQYPGVRQAADEFFGRDADMVRGWSGIFFNDVRKT